MKTEHSQTLCVPNIARDVFNWHEAQLQELKTQVKFQMGRGGVCESGND